MEVQPLPLPSMKVYVVVHYNYGDQGCDFHCVCKTKALADAFILEHEPDERERTCGVWSVIETDIIEPPPIDLWCNCDNPDIEWDGFGGGVCNNCKGKTF